jgi:hypothetical protein
MLAKEFLAKIENNEDIRGSFLIPIDRIVTTSVINGKYDTTIWGYYPYEIQKIEFSLYGKLHFQCLIVNKLGTSIGTNTYHKYDILSAVKLEKFQFNRNMEFFESEVEAIEECHLRNLGKKTLANGYEIKSLSSLFGGDKPAGIYY